MISGTVPILVLAASSVSGIVSAYLLTSLLRLPSARKAQLLARQLKHLATADLAYAVVEAYSRVLDIGIATGWTLNGMPEAFRNPYCRAFWFVSQVGNMAALLVECHIALTFAASICKSTRALQVLGWCLPFAWLLAVFLAIISAQLSRPYWDVPEGFTCSARSNDWISVAGILTVFVMCLVGYAVSTWHVCNNAGANVQRSVGSRARVYLFAAVVVCGPLAVYTSVPEAAFDGHQKLEIRLYQIAITVYNLSGLVHFAIYVMLCQRARKLRAGLPDREGGNHEAQREHSFRVTFRGHESVCDAPNQSWEIDRSEGASRSSDDPAEGYFGESWSDVSWYVGSSRRAAGGIWSAADFAAGAEAAGTRRSSESSHGRGASGPQSSDSIVRDISMQSTVTANSAGETSRQLVRGHN